MRRRALGRTAPARAERALLAAATATEWCARCAGVCFFFGRGIAGKASGFFVLFNTQPRPEVRDEKKRTPKHKLVVAHDMILWR